MRLVTIEDFRDIYLKAIQRGVSYLFSKVTFNRYARTKSAFNNTNISSANWWIIPEIHQRWNQLITGSPSVGYEEFVSKSILAGSEPVKLLSIGAGVCNHEILLAQLNPHWEISCVDFADAPLEKARKRAAELQLTNIQFTVANIYEYPFPESYYDVVMFHQALHHFSDISRFIPEKVMKLLAPHGKLMMHEYVGPNRLQFPRHQLKAIGECLSLVDRKYRTMFKSNLVKSSFHGSGMLRMIVSDPSECVDSEHILPTVHTYFEVVYERCFGGNILMCALKDIAHHFVEMDADKKRTLQGMFDFEDSYIQQYPSDFVFGVYQKK